MDHIPNNFHVGDLLSGTVTKLTNFGAFVRLEDDLEGLLHVSELADHKVNDPSEIVQPGMKVEVRVIRVDTEERKIGLSFVHSDFEENRRFAEGGGKAPSSEPKAEGSEGA
jgi:small subunit ribosomal protein S1